MKLTTTLAGLLAACLLPLFASATQEEAKTPSTDREQVIAALEDYVGAFYEAKPERLDRSLSKDMKKMGYWREPGQGEYSKALHMTFEQAKALATTWHKDLDRKLRTPEIVVYEVADKTACAKLTADWGIDYVQLVKEDLAGEDDRWVIHHILWQSHPQAKGPTSDGRVEGTSEKNQ